MGTGDRERFTIKEFAEYSGVSSSTLRYYDRIGLFQPAGRADNGYRYYSPLQLITLQKIGVLANLDTPLKDILRFMSDKSPQGVFELLAKQQQRINAKIMGLQESQWVAHVYRDMIWHAMNADTNQLELQELSEMAMFTVSAADSGARGAGADTHGADAQRVDVQSSVGTGFYRGLNSFIKAAERSAVSSAYPIGGVYRDMEEFTENPTAPTGYFLICPSGPDRAPRGAYISGSAQGDYGQFGDLPERMAGFAAKNSLQFKGSVYAVYLLDEIAAPDPGKYLARVFARVTAKKRLRARGAT
jgi:DNA-binding transcriptional MerR regulator